MTTSRSVGLISEIEVINSVLSVAGDAPIQSIDEAYQPVYIIRNMINNVSRDMQSKGYWFNTEYAVTFTVNQTTEKINLPFNILRFEPEDIRYVQRGNTIYDRDNRTDKITEDVVADLVVMLEFDQLPMSAREYIRAYCRIQYNNEYFGETNFKRELERALQIAETNLNKEHIENEDINVFSASSITNISRKNRRG